MAKKVWLEVLDYLKVIIAAIVIATLISTQVFTFSQVQQRSMEHTLVEGDALLIEKMSYHFSQPKKGDIIVLLRGESVDGSFVGRITRLYLDMYYKLVKQENEDRLVKRVIGLPGDGIDIREGTVYINGEAQVESYVTSATYAREVPVPFVVPDGQIFVLGDNREVSEDGRDFGCVSLEQVEGRAIFRIFPFTKIGTLK